MSQAKKSGLLRWLLLAACVAIACSTLALVGLYIARPAMFVSATSTAQRSKLVGTWVSDHGVVLDLRADGTATSQSTVKQREALRFDWSVSDNSLEIYQFARERNVSWAINYYVRARPTSSMEIRKSTTDALELYDARTGKTLRFRREKSSE
jgi:hypothetical protein